MKPGIISFPIRSSPARRSTVQRAVPQLQSSAQVLNTMLARANKDYVAKAPPPRNDLCKTLLPPSSPSPSANAGILDKWKTPSSVVASARINYESTSDKNQISTLRGTSKGPLASFLGNSNSFKHEPSPVVYLTGSSTQDKTNQAVWFAEDDFSDDNDLDLDFKAPSALPAAAVAKQAAQHSMPPPTQHVTWSSSPTSHWEPPKPQRDISGTLNTTNSTLKRESSGENDSFEAPAVKKAKKRSRLPWKSPQDPIVVEDDLPVVKTPAQKSSKGPWDPTASVIKEQKQKLKNQRKPDIDDARPEGLQQPPEAVLPAKQPISLSNEQKRVLDLVVNQNQSAFFTGPAGTGKSVLMRAIIEELKRKHAKDPERVAVTASTGLAACNIGGITLHSFSGIGLGKEPATALVKKIRRNPKAKNRWLRTKVLIIDEVSMVDGELFDKLSQIGRTIRNNGRPWGGIQLVITGDFFQLPPVPDGFGAEKREIKFAFEASTWSTSIDHTIGLTTVFRQRDPEFARMLNEMRLGTISESTERAFKALARPLNFNDGVDMAELYPTRAQVEGSNTKRLRELPGEIKEFFSYDSGDPAIRDKLLGNMMAPKSIQLKIGAQVMLIKNLDENLVNGSLGKVVAFSDEKTFEMTSADGYDCDDAMSKAKKKLKGFSRDSESESPGGKFPVVQFTATDGTSRVILCQPEEWKVELPNGDIQARRTQLPLILAWALSIHKAQGQTLERVTVNLGKIFEKGQAYVALSRATSQHGLQVLNFSKHKVQAHPRVVSFYRQLYSVDDAMATRSVCIQDLISNRKGSQAAAAMTEEEEAMASYGY